VKRKNEPYKGRWALPGGFVNQGEILLHAAARELEEETGVKVPHAIMRFVGYYDEPDRDPRGRTISFAWLANLDYTPDAWGMDDAVIASFFDPENLPPLAFDHATIIEDAEAVWLRQTLPRG
jgi:8-oxo-dGTP diphosphatase